MYKESNSTESIGTKAQLIQLPHLMQQEIISTLHTTYLQQQRKEPEYKKKDRDCTNSSVKTCTILKIQYTIYHTLSPCQLNTKEIKM